MARNLFVGAFGRIEILDAEPPFAVHFAKVRFGPVA